MSFFKKLKWPAFIKTKKFLFLLICFLFFFLFTPISFIQVSKKIENYIDDRAKVGVENFKKQTGLVIEWGKLDFKLLTLTVHLENVKINSLPDVQKIQELNFLDGEQYIQKISARPSIFSLFFDKKIFLAKLNIHQGEISLKTLQEYVNNSKNQRDSFQLPIKKISIKKTQVSVKHKEHVLNFSEIKSSFLQKENRRFDFDIFIKEASIDKLTHQKGVFQNLNLEIEKKYEISSKGVFRPDKLSVNHLFVKNDNFQSDTKSLDLDFEKGKIKKIKADSKGSLSFNFIQSTFNLFGKNIPVFGSHLKYKLNIAYEKSKGWQGNFEFSSEKAIFLSSQLNNLNVKGRLQNFLLLIDKGVLDIGEQGQLSIQKIELFLDKPYFNLTVQTKRLSSEFVMKKIFNQKDFPVTGHFTGQVACNGNYQTSVDCELQGASPRVQLIPRASQEIFSLLNYNLDLNISWNELGIEFLADAKKEDSQILFKGKYQSASNELTASYSLIGDTFKDIRFHLPFDLGGVARVRQGVLSIKNDKVETVGFIASNLLEIDKYKLENITSEYRFLDNKLNFFNIRANPGQTQYKAKLDVDFNTRMLDIQLDSNLFQLNDFMRAVKNHFSLPFNLEGTGTLAFSFRQSLNNPIDKSFDLKGNIFNVKIDNDFFKQSHFHFAFKEGQGQVLDFSLKKISAELIGQGFFDKDYNLNVNLGLNNVRLENFNFLNSIVPFNQTGDMTGKLKLTGPLQEFQVKGDLFVSNTFLYSYPIKKSKLEMILNAKGVSLSGNIGSGVYLTELFYSFEKDKKMNLKGQFKDIDLIAFLFSKSKKNKSEDYRSKFQGSFDLERKKDWIGKVEINKLDLFKLNRNLKMKTPLYIFLEKDRWYLTPTWFSDNKNRIFVVEEQENNKLLLKGVTNLEFFSVVFPFFEDLSADIRGQVIIENNLKNIQAKGSFEMESGTIQIPSLPEFKNLKGHLVFATDHLYINNLSGNAGGGVITGLGSIKNLFKPKPNLNFNFDFQKVHLEIPEGFNTKGSGQIKMKGSQTYLISGHYDVDGGSIVREFSSSGEQDYDFDLIKKEDTEATSPLLFDLKLKTKKPIQLNSSLIRASIEGETLVSGPLDELIMNGEIRFSKEARQNLIFFRGQEFQITSGAISFFNSKPKNPYINISANSVFKEKLIDPLEGQEEIENEYVISLLSKGFVDDLKYSLRSVPSLREKEIISLLTLGVSSRRFDSNVKQDVTSYSYQILASFLIEKTLNREIKEALGLDFRLTPYINTLNKPVNKMTLSRTWFEKWKSSVSRTLEESPQSDIRLKYNISPNIFLTTFLENNEQQDLDQIEENLLGFDFEFKFDF